MKKLAFGVFVLLLLTVLLVNGPDRKNAFDYPIPTETHYRAGFLIVKDGVVQDYSESKHFCNGVGDVAYINKKSVTWRDFFRNMEIDVPDNTYAYQRGARIDDILDHVVEENESVIFIVGEEPKNMDEILKMEITRDHIKEVPAQNEDCK